MRKEQVLCSVMSLTVPLVAPWGVTADEKSIDHGTQRPNIIYILADDVGLGDVGCYGQQRIETPNIDRLAREGMRFTQHYSGSAVSAPSRCCLMTGRHSGHGYIRANDEMKERGDVNNHLAVLRDSTLEGQRPLPQGTRTLATELKRAGYATGCVGTWCLGAPYSEGVPRKMGFDFFYGYHCQRQAHDYYPQFLYRNEHREYLPNRLMSPRERLDEGADIYDVASYEKYYSTHYAPELMFEEVKQFVASRHEAPFFLYWATPLVHVPLQAPQRWVDYYVEKFGDEAPYLGEKGYFPCRYPRATYAATISYMDEQIGLLLNQLEVLGIADNTIVIFSSDDGPTFNGGVDAPWFHSARPHRSESGWGKSSLHEGGIHVPMIVRWTGYVEPGSESDHVSAFWDVMPTLCEIAGTETPPTDGISFLPTLRGDAQPEHEYLYWELPEGRGSKALRMGRWKAFITNMRRGNSHVSLYDLKLDPEERCDVGAYYPEVLKTLKRKMAEAHEKPQVAKFEM